MAQREEIVVKLHNFWMINAVGYIGFEKIFLSYKQRDTMLVAHRVKGADANGFLTRSVELVDQ